MTQHTIVTLVHDRPGVLNRAVSLFRRRGLNLDSLTVTPTEREGVSRIIWVFRAADATPVVRQLEKLIDVLDVQYVTGDSASNDALHALVHATSVGTAHVPSLTIAQADGAA